MCVRQMLPYFFAYDRTNYARYMTIYWAEMEKLEVSHPAVYEQLKNGAFCVQRGNVPFSMVPVDQTIEQTLNRATKTRGGLIGFSLKPGAVQRWIVAAH